jgi:diguanylate cyclase (GGDEF)-like protein
VTTDPCVEPDGAAVVEVAAAETASAGSGVPDASADLLRVLFLESPIGVVRALRRGDRASEVLEANPAACALLGRPPEQLRGVDLAGLLEGPDGLRVGATGVRTAIRHVPQGDIRVGPVPGDGPAPDSGSVPGDGPAPDGARWVVAAVTPLSEPAWADGRPTVLVTLHDITEHHEVEERLDRAARHDPLTGLINRGELLRRLAAIDADDDGPHVAVIFIDLDGFKLVNDTRGHAVGDELLVAVARRIRGAVRPEDSLARIGGDEFVVVCPRLADPHDARAVAERVRATLDQPVSIEGRAHRISMSVGIASARSAAIDPPDLLRQADMAMYRAKDAGRNTVRIHSHEMDAELAAAERIREALGGALAAEADEPRPRAGSLVLHYQPVVEIGTGRLAYVESLARLRDSAGSLVYPSQFLPVAARAGLNGALSERVLRLALRQRSRWRGAGVDVPIGLNLARGQLFSASFAGDALRIIAAERDVPGAVVFEMEEFGLLAATGPAQLTLRRLRTAGIGLAIDHFGTGYSSLGALRFLGPHRVKIDRSFVASITASDADRAIVTAAISAAHALGQRVVAEGVETSQQLAVLGDLGCDEAQGFLVAQVLPADELRLPERVWEPGTLRAASA